MQYTISIGGEELLRFEETWPDDPVPASVVGTILAEKKPFRPTSPKSGPYGLFWRSRWLPQKDMLQARRLAQFLPSWAYSALACR
jgi:hypothetical protein